MKSIETPDDSLFMMGIIEIIAIMIIDFGVLLKIQM
jgi:hypothetical protein